jgi:hypothetical protein
MKQLLILAAAMSLTLGGCAATNAAGHIISAPVKLTAKTAEFTGKGIYGTTKLAGKTVIGTGKIAGKTVVGTGKGLYYIGSTPVHIANGALDTSNKVLRVTTQMVDLSGKVVKVSRDIQAFQLENELARYRGAKNIMDIAVSIVR